MANWNQPSIFNENFCKKENKGFKNPDSKEKPIFSSCTITVTIYKSPSKMVTMKMQAPAL